MEIEQRLREEIRKELEKVTEDKFPFVAKFLTSQNGYVAIEKMIIDNIISSNNNISQAIAYIETKNESYD